MRPRALAIICVVLLVGSFAARFFVEWFGVLPLTEEVVLKRAVALGVSYYDGGKLKAQYITDPVQVSEVLATLHINDVSDYYDRGFGSGTDLRGTTVEFHFPNGLRRNHSFNGANTLGSRNVHGAFAKKLTAIISEREGHPVDLTGWQPGAAYAPKQDQPEDGWNK